jgi:hypothetical protein
MTALGRECVPRKVDVDDVRDRAMSTLKEEDVLALTTAVAPVLAIDSSVREWCSRA